MTEFELLNARANNDPEVCKFADRIVASVRADLLKKIELEITAIYEIADFVDEADCRRLKRRVDRIRTILKEE